MIARMLNHRPIVWAALVAFGSAMQSGCTRSGGDANPDSGAYLASGGLPQDGQPQIPAAPPGDSPPADPISPDEDRQEFAGAPIDQTSNLGANDMANRPPSVDNDELFSIAEDEPPAETPTQLPQLRPDLPPAQLLEVLEGADKDMQLIVTGQSGITDPKQARSTLIHFMKMKLEASRRLMTHADADAKAKSEGARGELQALSHLASVGDLKAAVELEKLANDNMNSDDPRLVADSRLVLMGFAIESLQNGKDDAAERIVRYVDSIKNSEVKPDIPAMMVMGQAREELANYGHEEKAGLVRAAIIELFGDSPDPQIAEMAGQLAGNVRFDAIEKLRGQAVDGQAVSPRQWGAAVETLIDESADMQTVKYLAGAALEFESRELNDLVDATFAIATKRFDDENSATGREVRLAIRAYQARTQVIGRVFDPEPSADDDALIRLTDYRGKVVMIPFWAAGFPESLQLVTRLKSIQAADPKNTAIVGLNLDANIELLDQFLAANDLGFPSIRAQSSATDVATQFGLVSFPFVAILDQEGRVAAINFTGYELENTVKKLVQQ